MADLKDPKNQKLINGFIQEHAPLIHKHINILKSKGRIPPNIDEGDLHMAGMAGLFDALHKYNPDVASRTMTEKDENPFAKYAEKRIMGKILDHVAAQDEVTRGTKTKVKNLAALQAQQVPQTAATPAEPTAVPVETPVIKKPE